MTIIGILGGIGSGKSTVSTMFEKLGAFRVDADELAHAALRESDVISEIKDTWGEEVFTGDEVDRKKLAEAVFSSQKEVNRLNAIIHPKVISGIEEEISIRMENVKSVVLDAPLLAESGLNSICDVLVFVDTPLETRKERAALRNALSGKDFDHREKFQFSLDKKRGIAHHVVDNSRFEDFTFQQVSSIWKILRNSQTELECN